MPYTPTSENTPRLAHSILDLRNIHLANQVLGHPNTNTQKITTFTQRYRRCLLSKFHGATQGRGPGVSSSGPAR